MFGKRDVEMSPRRFWAWFETEAHGIANAFEALSRGEADADWTLKALNSRISRFNASVEADIVRTLDGQCHLTLSGDEKAVHDLLAAAPILRGWRFTPAADLIDRRRIPFRLAPRPSLDTLAQPLSGLYEAYA
jgi:hypothetical protein